MTTLRLDAAVLCVNCNTISDATNDHCPACSAHSGLLSLARVLDRPAPEPATLEALAISLMLEGEIWPRPGNA